MHIFTCVTNVQETLAGKCKEVLGNEKRVWNYPQLQMTQLRAACGLVFVVAAGHAKVFQFTGQGIATPAQ